MHNGLWSCDATRVNAYSLDLRLKVLDAVDRGSQYTSVEFGGRLKEAGLLPSMGSVDDAYDNALAESFVSTLKRELLLRHSSLGQMSPVEYEKARTKGAAVA